MTGREMKNAPSLMGWALAVAMGLVAFGVAIVVGEYDLVTSTFISAVLIVVVGLVIGMPWSKSETFDDLHAVRFDTGHGADLGGKALATSHDNAVVAKAEAPAVTPSPLMAAPAVASDESATSEVYDGPMTEPVRLTGPRAGKADNLKEIEGIGPALEKLCNELGFYHFDQIANWSQADVAWVDQNMKTFKGRIIRDKWVAQAKLIMAEGLDAFRVRAKTNDY
ncbi:MAG: NADH:ubiquinone oxidoreductase [Rhodobacteraceae bacterium]|nr:NADH:ubiquinone oxidoreductase [Paracoccaceae bacterium]MCF8515490.1 NADH:ubiquinone oxidoreductase [Paracoccaceae bacterium]MCF8519735.1 NADH:ubiquinone oxidoreductase [Paracoccaceae bacterium]